MSINKKYIDNNIFFKKINEVMIEIQKIFFEINEQMNNVYKCNSPNLIPLYETAKELSSTFKIIQLNHIYRNKNKRADELSNLGVNRSERLKLNEMAVLSNSDREEIKKQISAAKLHLEKPFEKLVKIIGLDDEGFKIFAPSLCNN